MNCDDLALQIMVHILSIFIHQNFKYGDLLRVLIDSGDVEVN